MGAFREQYALAREYLYLYLYLYLCCAEFPRNTRVREHLDLCSS
jgi:hypothetical protein